MDITWFGQSAFIIKGKNATVAVDPFGPEIGLKYPKQKADILLMTHEHQDHHFAEGVEAGFTAEGPGEYEVKDVSIVGTRVYHDNQKGAERGVVTAFSFVIDDITICHLGDLGHELSGEQIEELSNSNVLLIPVGGHYTIDATTAAKVAAQLEPSIVIPMHYKVPGLKIEELAEVEDFMKAMGKNDWQAQPNLKITKDSLPEELSVTVLEARQ